MFHIDNSAVVSALSSGTIKNSHIMNTLRSIVMLAAWMCFSHSSSWFTSAHNVLIHAISHLKYAHLFSITPSMQQKPCPMHPQLCGIKHTLTYHPAWLSSYGTASPSRPTQPIGQDISCSQTSLPYTQFRKTDGSALPAEDNQVLHYTPVVFPHGCQPTICSLQVALLQQVIRGIKRYMCERECNPKMPITCEVLR